MLFNELNKSDWEQIANYLSGEMDNDEKQLFQQRINSSEENKSYFNQVKKDWEKMDNYKKTENNFDVDKAWGKLYSKFEEDGLLEVKKDAKVINMRRWLQVAAVFLLGAVLTSLVYYFNSDNTKGLMLADSYNYKGIKEVKLSDGSIVYLNADSKLYYPEKFGGSTRTVEFEGDAFFEIAKNPSRPFIIKARKAQIKVVGTSFNVNTNLNENKVEVLVETGKVQLSDVSKDSFVDLEPGYMGTLSNGKLDKNKNTDINYMAWRTRKFDFRNGIELGKAIEVLNRSFHVNIQCNDSDVLKKELHSGFSENPSLESILNILCANHNLKMNKTSDKIVLSAE